MMYCTVIRESSIKTLEDRIEKLFEENRNKDMALIWLAQTEAQNAITVTLIYELG